MGTPMALMVPTPMLMVPTPTLMELMPLPMVPTTTARGPLMPTLTTDMVDTAAPTATATVMVATGTARGPLMLMPMPTTATATAVPTMVATDTAVSATTDKRVLSTRHPQ